MSIVNTQNKSALSRLAWAEVDDPADSDVLVSFLHQAPVRPDTSGRVRMFYTCTTSHNSLLNRYTEAYRNVARHERNRILVLNHAMKDAFSRAGIEVAVWNHGVDLESFHPVARADAGRLTFGFVGQGARFKRSRFVLDAFLAAFGSRDRGVRLSMVGGGRESPAPNVEVIPSLSRERLPEFYASLDCFVMFSYSEGFNMTTIEALACGIPCLVTDSPEMHEPPYDGLCTHVPARRIVRPEVLLGENFAPRDPHEYHTPPWVHEVSMDDAVESLRSFRDRPRTRRSTPLAERFSWGGRIVEQLLPILPDVYGPQGGDPSFRRIWNDPAMPRYRKPARDRLGAGVSYADRRPRPAAEIGGLGGRPNQVRATDVTHIPMAKGFVYLVALSWTHRPYEPANQVFWIYTDIFLGRLVSACLYGYIWVYFWV